MSDFLSLSCPSCGGVLKSLAGQPNYFVCEHCENEYLLKQSGNAITLRRISENVLNVGSNSTVVQARTVYMGAQSMNESQTDIPEIVECPICGKRVNKNETFYCKKCQRSNICSSHQDSRSYACSECVQHLKDGVRQMPSYWKAIGLNLLGGVGLFYVDRKSKRKWVYPVSILLFLSLGIAESYEDPFGFFWRMGFGLFWWLGVPFYLASFIDVIVTCTKKRKAIAKQFV